MPSAILIISSGSPHHLLLEQTHCCLVLSWIPADCLTLLWCYARIASGYACYTFCQQSNKTHTSLSLNDLLQISTELLSSSIFDVILLKINALILQAKRLWQGIKLVPRLSCTHWLLSKDIPLPCDFAKYKPYY